MLYEIRPNANTRQFLYAAYDPHDIDFIPVAFDELWDKSVDMLFDEVYEDFARRGFSHEVAYDEAKFRAYSEMCRWYFCIKQLAKEFHMDKRDVVLSLYLDPSRIEDGFAS